MIITNKTVITTKDQNNLEPLHDFVSNLFEKHNMEKESDLDKSDYFEEGAYSYYRIPKEMSSEFVILEGAELCGIEGNEVFELPGTHLTQYKHTFTPIESEENAQSMARSRREIRELKAQQAQSNASYNAKIKEAEASLDKFGSWVETGFDDREEKTTIIIDFNDKKRYYKSVLTKEIVKEEELLAQDKQMMMAFPPVK